MPFSSSVFTSVASLKRGGGSVKCCSGRILCSFSVSPSLDLRQAELQFLVFLHLRLFVLALFVNGAEAVELLHGAGGAQQCNRRRRCRSWSGRRPPDSSARPQSAARSACRV